LKDSWLTSLPLADFGGRRGYTTIRRHLEEENMLEHRKEEQEE
jgi:hypothetical protein